MRTHTEKHGELSSLKLDEGTYATQLTRKYRERDAWERPKPSEVHSYIPGMVVKIFATEGQRLSVGDSILTFEAMKMENTLTMPYDGVVTKIHVKIGDVFAKDIILAEIKPENV
jgi:biotin carboxyl carrier protein